MPLPCACPRQPDGGRAPGGADAVNERPLSIRCRNEAEVRGCGAGEAQGAGTPREKPEVGSCGLHGSSWLSMLLAMLHREKRTGKSGPAAETSEQAEEVLILLSAHASEKGEDSLSTDSLAMASRSRDSLPIEK